MPPFYSAAHCPVNFGKSRQASVRSWMIPLEVSLSFLKAQFDAFNLLDCPHPYISGEADD